MKAAKYRYGNFELGKLYKAYWNWKRVMIVKFIKVTPKGYNFLEISTSKCIMKRHTYKQKNQLFTYSSKLTVQELTEDEIKDVLVQ